MPVRVRFDGHGVLWTCCDRRALRLCQLSLYDTAACRAVQASLAYDAFSYGTMPSQVTHGGAYRCPLASKTSSSQCKNSSVPTCDYFCEEVMTQCTGPRAQFESFQGCKTWCGANSALSPDMHTDVCGSYTIGCLTYLAKHATSDELCSASKTGGSICPAPAPEDPAPSPAASPVCAVTCPVDQYLRDCVCVSPVFAHFVFAMSIQDYNETGVRVEIASGAGIAGADIGRVVIRSADPYKSGVYVSAVILPEAGKLEWTRQQAAAVKANLGEAVNFELASYTSATLKEDEAPTSVPSSAPKAYQFTETKKSEGGSDDLPLILGLVGGGVTLLALVGMIAHVRSRRQRVSGISGCLGIPQPTLEPQRFVDLTSQGYKV